MSLKRTPLNSLVNLVEVGAISRSASPKTHPSLTTIRKMQKSARHNRFKTALKMKRPSVQIRRQKTQRIHQGRGLTTVGGRLIRKSMTRVANRVVNRLRKLRHTGSYSPFKKSHATESVGHMTRVEAYEALVNVLHESRRAF